VAFSDPSDDTRSEADAEPMTAECRSRRFQARDRIGLHCLHWSPAPADARPGAAPVVLLHGGGANAWWWSHLAAPLAIGRDVYALDFRGHGDSDHPTERVVGAFNVDLEALVEWIGREDVVLVGHSMGAGVALDHASRFPKTRGLVLIDLARGGAPGGGRRARLALSLRRTYRSRAEAIERFRFLPEAANADESLRQTIAEHSVKEEPDGRFGYKFDPGWFSLPTRPRPDLARIRCPTLLVRGGESQLLSTEGARQIVQRIERARLVEIAGAGHHVLIDQPKALLEELRRFIESVDTETGRDD
jgi:pimeloyl-ACP methyl ester carboxylesterase